MAKTMEIILPDGIEHYERDLRLFVDLMIQKLYQSRHKGFADDIDYDTACELLNQEIVELSLATANSEPQFAATMETVDISNMAFIVYLVLSRMNKMEYKELGKPNEQN